MEKADVHRAGSIAHRDVENGAAAALETDGGSAAAGDFGENRLHLARDDFGDGREAEAVFVAEGKIAEQVADGDDAASFESGGAVRADAVEVFDRVGEGDGHVGSSLLYHRLWLGCVSRGKSKDLTQSARRKPEKNLRKAEASTAEALRAQRKA